MLSDYVADALVQATYEKLEDGSYAGRVPSLSGSGRLGASLRECENEMRSTLEDWVLVGLQLKHPLPIVQGIHLNKERARAGARHVNVAILSSNFAVLGWKALFPGPGTSSRCFPRSACPSHQILNTPCRNYA